MASCFDFYWVEPGKHYCKSRMTPEVPPGVSSSRKPVAGSSSCRDDAGVGGNGWCP